MLGTGVGFLAKIICKGRNMEKFSGDIERRPLETHQDLGANIEELAAAQPAQPHNSLRTRLAVGAAVLAGAVGLAETNRAIAEEAPVITNEGLTMTSEVHIAKSKASSKSVAKIEVWANNRTVSKAKIKEAEESGGCDVVSGSEAIDMGIQTQGYNGSGVGYAPENRRSTLCDLDGDGDYDVRAECGNKVIDRRPQPEEAKYTMWVNNWNKAKGKVKAKAKAFAEAECKTANTSAYARGEAYASAIGRFRIKSVAGAEGEGIEKIVVETEGNAAAKARARARAKAVAKCEESDGSVPPPAPANQPPGVDLVDRQHSITGDVVEVCAYGSDPEGQSDIVNRSMTESGDGNFTTNIYNGDESGEFCRRFAAGTSEGTAVITAKVIDTAGNSASDTESWPIVDTFGRIR